MMRKGTYDLFSSLNALKGIISFCLLLTMLVQPVVTVIFDVAAVECELHENGEEKESEEKESTDSEEEDTKHYYSFSQYEFNSINKYSFFVLQKDLIGSHLETPFPPPDRA